MERNQREQERQRNEAARELERQCDESALQHQVQHRLEQATQCRNHFSFKSENCFEKCGSRTLGSAQCDVFLRYEMLKELS